MLVTKSATVRGENPADYRCRHYELAINLKAVKVVGLDLPATVLARAR